MPIVDVRWRPSGGRGEYEHVPADVLLNRTVAISTVMGAAPILTDVRGYVRDGKPRLRRANPNNRLILNLPQLVAALALLPDSVREDRGHVVFPLRHKAYVISSITFSVEYDQAGVAICSPLRMRILHDGGEIDLVSRIERVNELLRSELVPSDQVGVVARFLSLVESGSASSELRRCADGILEWLSQDAEASSFLDAPSDAVLSESPPSTGVSAKIGEMSADETRRKLRAHYKIDRSRKIRSVKVEQFKAKYGAIYCENCSFDFSKKYGRRGDGFIEVHHIVPLAAILPNTVTYLTDLLLLCSNCHRMVHRSRPDLSPAELKVITKL